jgi:hypothetical protein
MASNPSTRKKRRPRQLELTYRTWGGRRKGAGRKKTSGATPHRKRPPLASRHPVHITLSVDPNLPHEGLRRPDLSACIEDCLREIRRGAGAGAGAGAGSAAPSTPKNRGGAGARTDFRVVHYSIQRHHLHLVVEAANREALSRGMQGLTIRVAKRINKVLGRRGKVFIHRYFETVVKSARQARNVLSYVLLNTQRHLAQSGQRCEPGWIDPCSSGRYFDGWRGFRVRPPPDEEPSVSEPHTWILSTGWRRFGLVSLDAVPGGRVRRSKKV